MWGACFATWFVSRGWCAYYNLLHVGWAWSVVFESYKFWPSIRYLQTRVVWTEDKTPKSSNVLAQRTVVGCHLRSRSICNDFWFDGNMSPKTWSSETMFVNHIPSASCRPVGFTTSRGTSGSEITGSVEAEWKLGFCQTSTTTIQS